MTARRFPPPWSVEEQPACFAEVATTLALAAHERRRPPFSGPKSLEVRRHGTAGDDGAVVAKH
jgi:hypothetical protein